MFKIIDINGDVQTAYGTFVDEYDSVQFILCDYNGHFYRTDVIGDYYKLYEDEKEHMIDKIATFFESDNNWSRLHECWMFNGRSDELRDLLREALK